MTAPSDPAMRAKYREAIAAWPSILVEASQFDDAVQGAHVATGMTLEALHTADLYLVVACLAGNAGAVAILERDILGEARPAIERVCRQSGAAEDIVQATLSRLLIGPPAPKLAQYMGRGTLVSWVRVVVVREALQAIRRTKKEVLTEADALLDAAGGANDSIDFVMLRDRYASSFEEAVREAIGQLVSEQRVLLRLSLCDGLSIDRIGLMLGIHRATAARRLAKVRADVLAQTYAILRERHGLSDSEVRSVCRALGNEISLSLVRALDTEHA